MPRRSPPPPPTGADSARAASQTGGSGGPIGAFWATQHAKESAVVEEPNKVKFDEEPSVPERRFSIHRTSPPKNETSHSRSTQKSVPGKLGPSKDAEMNFFQDGPNAKSSDGFNAFATEFGINKVSSGRSSFDSGKEEKLEAEVERLREQLKQVNEEKSELSSKYEKLSAICRSQRQELHELKQAFASTTPPNKTSSKTQSPSQQVKFSTSHSYVSIFCLDIMYIYNLYMFIHAYMKLSPPK